MKQSKQVCNVFSQKENQSKRKKIEVKVPEKSENIAFIMSGTRIEIVIELELDKC